MTPAILRSLLLALVTLAACSARTYHIDAAAANDLLDGLTPATAWKSLDKFNATVFKPDDRILFKSGQHWAGQLRPLGSGSSSANPFLPIRIGRYGVGDLPQIDGAGRSTATLLIRDVEYWEVCDLAITNLGATTAPDRTGVRIQADSLTVMRGITLRGLHVHDVNGDLRKSHEGHGILFEASPQTDSSFDGILIENCKLERTDRNGICQRAPGKSRSKNVIIRSNILSDIGGDGIKLWGTNGGLIERNIVRNSRARCTDNAAGIWPFACDDTIIQYNEVIGTKGTKDGQAFDSDYLCKRTIIQYNYSYQNEGGFMLVCSPGNSYNIDTLVRHNVSVHDGINSARVIQIGGNPTNTRFIDNTIVLGPNQNLPLVSFNEWEGGNAKDTSFIHNNLIVSDGGKATYAFGKSTGTRFSNNMFVGRHDGLPEGVRTAFQADRPERLAAGE
ncbi:MAG: right-handed parallel beta-helix repeat-containing protein [Verrucomicrobia bacterium]|nr:right-handed parallel beta-helix repeat-containing protein [Verrucomicrobiota bacterium]